MKLYCYTILYSKIPISRPPFELPISGLICEVVLISNIISKEKYRLGLAKTGLNSEVVLILSGLNCEILLYIVGQGAPLPQGICAVVST